MEIEDPTATAEYTDEEKRARRRQLAQQAITLALQSRWQEAADINRQIVEVMPNDAEAYNRLGKAYTELGEIEEARAAYEGAMRADPANLIAQRNLDRLSRISPAEAAELAKKSSVKLDPRFFMEETGKTGVTTLQHPAAAEVLATLTAGDRVELETQSSDLVVKTITGTYVGRVSGPLAVRLTRLMQTGNEYQAGVVGIDDHTVRIIIRETHQSPQNMGRISFPPQVESLPRPYLREGLVRRGTEDEEDEDYDTELADTEGDDDEEEAGDFGFHETNLDEV